MTRWRPLPLLLLASVFLGACGVPISAADLTMTPEPTSVDVTLLSRVAVEGRAFEGTEPSIRAAALAPNLATPLPITPIATSTQPATGTAMASPTPTSTATPTPFGTPPATSTPLPSPTPTPNVADLIREAVSVLNKTRTDSGRPALVVDANLALAAANYAKLMADNRWFTCGCDPHIGPDGSRPEGRLAAAGYTGRFKGETLSAGQSTGQAAIVAWLNSPAHAAIALDTSAADVGIGYAYNPNDPYRHYWVLVTGVK